MPEIVLPAQRHRKSSRGTPRLRRPLRTLHGAPRLAMSTTTLFSDCAVVLLTRQRAELLHCCIASLSASMRGHSVHDLRRHAPFDHCGRSVQS